VRLLAPLRGCFTAPAFRTFCALVAGMLAGGGRRTVCGMLAGAGLSRLWPHDRAHHFFAGAAWSAEALGLALARLVVGLLVPPGQPIKIVVDDTLFKRSGRKVWAAGFFHDGSAKDNKKIDYGNTWVILGIVVRLPMLRRPVCLPVLARLVRKDSAAASRLWLAVQMVTALARAFPGRGLDLAADGAYAGGELQALPPNVTVVTTVRKDAALHALPPPRTGKRGRPRQQGDKLPKPEQLAATLPFVPVTATCYGETATVYVATRRCLWPGVFGYRAVTLVLIRNKPGVPRGGYDIALVITDVATTTGATGTGAADTTATDTGATGTGTDTDTAVRAVEGYAARWSIEVSNRDGKQDVGVGQAHNRVKLAVERTVPFGLFCQTLVVLWYATAGHHPADAADHRERAPWYTGKAEPSTTDMLAKLRRVLIATRYRAEDHPEPTPAEIHAIRLAWETEAA
jgi:hypothetical protein